MKSSVYKVITGIIAALGFVGGIMLGNTSRLNDFNFGLMLSSWVGTALLCLIFYGIASILSYLEELGAGADDESVNQPSIVSSENDEEPLEIKNGENCWECPNCHSKNPLDGSAECPKCHWTP